MVRTLKALEVYLNKFRNTDTGIHNFQPASEAIKERFGCERVLYPGSYLHVTPSLVFSDVSYVDSLKGIGKALGSPDLLEYLQKHKSYSGTVQMRGYEEDYSTFCPNDGSLFDLLISLNAGLISQNCKQLLKQGGLLLVNDTHFDASHAYLDPDYQLIGAFENLYQSRMDQCLSSYFKTRKGESLTPEMVQANAERPPSKARFKLAKQADAYLFQKVH